MARNVAGLTLVVGISALAGMTDAIGFLASGDFVSFMSGNTTRLAVAVGEGATGDAIRLSAILAIFVAGNAIGVVVARATGGRIWPVLLFAAGLTGASAGVIGAGASAFAFLSAVLAMGALNAAVESVAGVGIGLTYITGALSRLGKGIGRLICGERGLGFAIHALPWAGMFGGAILGTALCLRAPGSALAATTLFAVAIALAAALLPHAWQQELLDRPL